jgi:hypothetical protein
MLLKTSMENYLQNFNNFDFYTRNGYKNIQYIYAFPKYDKNNKKEHIIF